MKTKKLHSFSARLMSMMALAFVLFIASCEKDDPTPEPQATCDDGIQNGDETGIDCGGSCSACEEPSTMSTPNLNSGTIDMEEDGMGPDFSEDNESNEANPDGTWGVFGSDAANKIELEIVSNPNTTGNASAKVLKIEEEAGQEPWQGFFFDLDSKVSLTAPNTAISVDVHSLRAGQKVLLKLEDRTNNTVTTGDIIKETTGTGWETITYNLSADYSGLFDRVVFIMDFGVVNDAQVNHYIDNIRVSEPVDEGTGGGGGGTGSEAPTEGPAAPSTDAANVISLFSDSYDDVAVDTWQTEWSNVGAYEEVDLNGNMAKKYTDLGFAGIETVQTQVNASEMTHLNMDVWSANVTAFKIKLVDFGATGGYSGEGGDGQGDDTEHEVTTAPAQGEWVTLSIPLSDFTGLTAKSNIAQMIISGEPYEELDIYIDNVYFSNNGGSTGNDAPTEGPAAPSPAAADVISLFSDSYDDVTVDTWLTEWSNDGQGVTAELAEIDLNGNNVKKYSKFGFVGIETSSAPVDASSMTHFNFDYWTSNATVMKIKLVDWGADKGYDGGDDSEHEIALSTVTQGEWVSVSIPLSDFSGMTATEAIAQYILVAEPWLESTVYIDNVFFSKE
jgi:hypothetical protein